MTRRFLLPGLLVATARFSITVLFVATAGILHAQDPQAVAPHAYQTQFENDRVRVTRVHYAANETIAEHAHPSNPSVYLYLNDGPAIAFKHQHGDSKDYAATRPATKSGAYRLAAGRNETHIVENSTDRASDFLQVEIKTAIDVKTFNGRLFRETSDVGNTFARVEFENEQLRITRSGCATAGGCQRSIAHPALTVAIPAGSTTWIEPGQRSVLLPGEQLLIEFK